MVTAASGIRGCPSLCWVLGFSVTLGCNPIKFKKCRDEMTSSQKVLIDMDDQDILDVKNSLQAVQATIEVCDGVAGDEDVAKLRDAKTKLEKQVAGLEVRAAVKERPRLSADELAELEKRGDRGCPRGQQYEHPQNKKLIKCTGPQVVDMTWSEAVEQFNERRGFSEHAEGAELKFESGAEVVTFDFRKPEEKAPARCVTIVGQPGISWQEIVARATGVQPRVMKLEKPIPSAKGPLPLLVEGTAEQFVVKLGQCAPTPGQKPYIEPTEP